MGYKPENELRSASIKAALTKEEKAEIEAFCIKHNLSLSEFARGAIRQLLDKDN